MKYLGIIYKLDARKIISKIRRDMFFDMNLKTLIFCFLGLFVTNMDAIAAGPSCIDYLSESIPATNSAVNSPYFLTNSPHSADSLSAQVGSIIKKRMTQKELAAILGVTQGYITKVVGGSKPLRQDYAAKVAEVLGLDMSDLFTPADSAQNFYRVNGDALRQAMRGSQESSDVELQAAGSDSNSHKIILQDDLAQLLGVTQSLISRVLHRTRPITKENANLIADFFGLDIYYLFKPIDSHQLQWTVKEDYLQQAMKNGVILIPGEDPIFVDLSQDRPEREKERLAHLVERALELNASWKKEVGLRLKSFMRFSERRVKQAEVAELLGVTQGYVSDVINGKQTLNLERARKIAAHYDLDLTWLLAADLLEESSNAIAKAPTYSHRNFPEMLKAALQFRIINPKPER